MGEDRGVENGGQQVGGLKRSVGKIVGHYATLFNILQLKKTKGRLSQERRDRH